MSLFWTTLLRSCKSSPMHNRSGSRSIQAMTMAATLPVNSNWIRTTRRCYSSSRPGALYPIWLRDEFDGLEKVLMGVIGLQVTIVKLNLTKRRLTLMHTLMGHRLRRRLTSMHTLTGHRLCNSNKGGSTLLGLGIKPSDCPTRLRSRWVRMGD